MTFASVLGVVRNGLPNNDLNNIPLQECKYEGYNPLTNAPWATNDPFIVNVESMPNHGNWLTKQTATNGSTGKSYYRVYRIAEGWNAWKEI